MRRANWARYAFVPVALVMVGYTAAYTELYSQSVTILAQLQAINLQQMSDKAERFYRVYTKRGDPTPGTGLSPGDARFEAYIRTYEDLLDTDAKLSTYMPLSEELNQQEARVPVVSDVMDFIGSHARTSAATAGGQKDKDNDHSYNLLPVASSPSSTPANVVLADADTDDSLSLSDAHKQDKELFLQHAGLNQIEGVVTGAASGSVKAALQGDLWKLQRNVEFFGMLVLPALYGMVGTLVYYMRRLLDGSDMGPSASIYIVRIALGGLAGVSGGYLLESVHAGETVSHAPGAGLFVLAFLFGFSSDLFFKLIDRAVTMISDSITPPKPGATA